MSLTANQIQDIAQKLHNARCAIILHKGKMASLGKVTRSIDALSLCVPILFLVWPYLPEGIREPAKAIGEIASVFLIGLVVLGLTMDWRGSLAKHEGAMAKNVDFLSRLKALLDAGSTANPSSGELEMIRVRADELDAEDGKLLPKISRTDRHTAYREAIKQAGSDAVCPVCGSSPWRPKLDARRECCGNAERPQALSPGS